ncbi:MAG: hypothetical protein ACD_16C00103G0005 [uncultured bacterium]|nr:MAG: hypothetical protein ACD_16C00103G0005 [uncultured bacterium]OFW70203.1 MAG: hypothetical protein A2X70_00245 [Alphaproteobacteria bacterium GWC2_42_16]OFW73798.1 MAG: hypothetical protein A2Z80_05715 [Alphaproteobacteria bacterium GWA2_41_27]OFW84823.1 MAG: hypothetical protein A2W06_04450 [Alphaproteobacteria bacterium RBG_16_42_14]OFW84935.1 MAG: hypothetical protein A3E50_02015 [Alphaproteobacteria bacterium RIFCSPHIGHO2_12_FULL_42_100]OFW91221.1 MAG: hypothetical protein A3C41_061
MTPHDLDIFTRTLYGEARGEYTHGGPAPLMAVANVIINRLNRGGKYGRTITDICLKPRQFSCWNKNDPNRPLLFKEGLERDPLFYLCKTIAENISSGRWPDLTRDSDHYHELSCRPSWARTKKVRLRLGHHIFYKLD